MTEVSPNPLPDIFSAIADELAAASDLQAASRERELDDQQAAKEADEEASVAKLLDDYVDKGIGSYEAARRHYGIPEPAYESKSRRAVKFGEATEHVDPELNSRNKRGRELAEQALRKVAGTGYTAPEPHQVMDSHLAGLPKSPYAKHRGPAA